MSDQWHLSRGGEVFGPYSSAQLHELARGGRVDPGDMVRYATSEHWYAAAEIQGLFPAPPAPAPAPAPQEEDTPAEAAEDDSSSYTRSRRAPREAPMSPLYWMVPMGGAAVLGLITVVVLFSGRSKNTQPDKPRPAPVVRKPAPERPRNPHVERPEGPVDYSIPKVDYTQGPRGEKILSHTSEDKPDVRAQVFLDSKGNRVLHGKREEFYPGTETKKSEQWWYDGKLYGPSYEWDEKGNRLIEGQYSRDMKHGKWVTFYPSGTVAREEFWYRGKKHGAVTAYHPNGKKAMTATFKQGRRIGPSEYWDETGKPRSRDESLQADLKPATYDEMIDLLGPPSDVHEARQSKGELYLWKTDNNRFIAIWITKDANGKEVKGDIKGVQLSKEEVEELKRQLR